MLIKVFNDREEACRQQRIGEAWFADISAVPKKQAISMSVHQILKSKEILAVVSDARKAEAVKACFEGEISPMAPATYTQKQGPIWIRTPHRCCSALRNQLNEPQVLVG
jgi:glucosamine-6-phosphate deaminase